MPRTQKIIPIVGDESGEGRLTIQDQKFIDALLRTGDKVKAFIESYPDTKAKNQKTIQTMAGQHLRRLEIRSEIRARYAQSRITKPYLIQKTQEVLEYREPKYYKSKVIARVPHMKSVDAARLVAEMCGYIEKNPQGANINNIIVNFPLMYSPEEKKKFEQGIIEGERLTE